ncbi:hypothetical protein B296_00036322 [Ensete ventricosum]|uniref:Uncharacterized protein n=1 Tax=Ensete ventricosum TaxID=4639 RepID=A0A426XLM6_ENSVE|nr:hypothetical protein B296_00036322 [Ensete ventricosum]
MVASKEERWMGPLVEVAKVARGIVGNWRLFELEGGVTIYLRLLVRPHPSLSSIEERGKATEATTGATISPLKVELKEEDARRQRVKCSFKKRRANRMDRAMGGSPFVDRMRTRKRNGVAVAKRDAHTGARKRSKCMFWFGWGGG